MQRICLILMIAFTVPLLSACGENLPDASDEQILLLLGSSIRSEDDAPLTISKTRLECARLLSGLDDDVYVDFPEEMMGAFKTDCRIELSELIEDPDRNTAGFTLDNFEAAELGERVTQIRSDAEKKAKAFYAVRAEQREAEKARIEAERVAEIRLKIQSTKTLVNSIVASLDERIATLSERCQVWATEVKALKERNRRSHYAFSKLPHYCKDKYFQSTKSAAQNAVDQVTQLESRDVSNLYSVRAIQLGYADPKEFEKILNRLNTDIEKFRSIE